jgi:hypothetical protein
VIFTQLWKPAASAGSTVIVLSERRVVHVVAQYSSTPEFVVAESAREARFVAERERADDDREEEEESPAFHGICSLFAKSCLRKRKARLQSPRTRWSKPHDRWRKSAVFSAQVGRVVRRAERETGGPALREAPRTAGSRTPSGFGG